MAIPVAILWHQHQPYYKNLVSGELAMPWARLHGVKDYYGMARLFELSAGMRGTINLVPSLVAQLLDYVEHGATDPFLRLTRTPAEELSAADAQFILDHFFMAQWDRMVRPHHPVPLGHEEVIEYELRVRRAELLRGRPRQSQERVRRPVLNVVQQLRDQ